MDYPVVFSSGSVTKFCYDYVIPTALSTACHPFVTARTLMMVFLLHKLYLIYCSWDMNSNNQNLVEICSDCNDICILMSLTTVSLGFALFFWYSWSSSGRGWSLSIIHRRPSRIHYWFSY